MMALLYRFLYHFFSIPNLPINPFAVVVSIGFLFACQSSPDPWLPVGGASAVGGSAGVGGLIGADAGTSSTLTGGNLTVSGSGGSEAVAGSGASAGSVVVAGSEGIIGTLDSGVSDRSYGNGVFGGSGGTGTVTPGTGGVVTPPPVCTANATESEACGECPEITHTRQCLQDGSDWGVWSECECPPVLPTECDGQTETPTWNNSVGTIMQSSCSICHIQASSYSSFVRWRGGSTTWDSMWTQSFAMHRLAPDNLAVYNCWIVLGLPEN